MEKENLWAILGKNLQKLRNERKLTQDDLSEKAGISVSFYANLESGNKGVSVITLINLASCLDVSIDNLITGDHANASLENINILLRDMPEDFVRKIEKIIRVTIELPAPPWWADIPE